MALTALDDTDVESRLRAHADEAVAKHAARFFRTEPGGYGEGDHFLGVRVPAVRRVAREFRHLDTATLCRLLDSQWHEVRLLALILLGHRYARASEAEREAIYGLYLRRAARVNNWDLVDTSAPQVAGVHLLKRDRTPLHRLARSKSVWERRIACSRPSTSSSKASWTRPFVSPSACFTTSTT